MIFLALTALIGALAAPALANGTTAEPARLTLTFQTESQSGAVLVSLFDSEAAYAGGAPVRQARVDVGSGQRTAVFPGLKEGVYAVRAVHDLNGDGRMSSNPFGRPIEPFAFSNNARGFLGPARWERVRIMVAGETAQTIEIR